MTRFHLGWTPISERQAAGAPLRAAAAAAGGSARAAFAIKRKMIIPRDGRSVSGP